MAEVRDEALLLRRVPYGDTSLICHFFTSHHGRIVLMVRGARRAKSPFRATLAPLHELMACWRPGRTGMGTLLDMERGEKLVDERLDLEGLELCSAAAGLFQEGDPHGYAELRRSFALMHGKEPATALLAGLWQLLHDGGWVGDLFHCWQCGRNVADGEEMAWQSAELICNGCGSGLALSAGMRKAILAQYGSGHVRLSQSDLSRWQRMIQDVLGQHGVRNLSLMRS